MIQSGTLLIEKDTPKPACFQFQPGPDSESWAPVTHDLSPRDLEKALSANGWTFHYLAGAIRATAFGFNEPDRVATALKRLIAIATRQHCNCLEIDEVSTRSFLGIPHASVSAHMRNVQKGMIFSGR